MNRRQCKPFHLGQGTKRATVVVLPRDWVEGMGLRVGEDELEMLYNGKIVLRKLADSTKEASP